MSGTRCHGAARRGAPPVLGALCLWLSACGGRSELASWQPPGLIEPGSGADEPAARVEFPSLEQASAVPEPDGPPPRMRMAGDSADCVSAGPSLDQLLERISADAREQPAADRPFLRYISTASLAPPFCGPRQAFEVALDALPLLLNSISLSAIPARLRVVDPDSLLSIDLRELRWDRALRIGERDFADGWEALVAYAPQALALRGPETDALLEQLGTRVALLQMPDLLRAALSADAYYGLLDTPGTLSELRSALGIPADLEREPNAYWRAVTTRSRISRQDRLLLRYRAPVEGPVFWLTVELRPETAHGGAFADPLTRQGDESAVLYALPNGLPGYFLADGEGQRLNESRVLIDTSQDDFVPRTAPSCVGCHSSAGVLPVRDELRPYAATDPNGRFDAAERALIAEVYPEQSALDELIQADKRRFAAASLRAGAPRYGGIAPDLLRLPDRDLTLESAAAELFVSSSELRERRLELPGPVRVLTSLGSLDRASFSAVYGEALCALSVSWRNRPADCP